MALLSPWICACTYITWGSVHWLQHFHCLAMLALSILNKWFTTSNQETFLTTAMDGRNIVLPLWTRSKNVRRVTTDLTLPLRVFFGDSYNQTRLVQMLKQIGIWGLGDQPVFLYIHPAKQQTQTEIDCFPPTIGMRCRIWLPEWKQCHQDPVVTLRASNDISKHSRLKDWKH